MNELSLALHTKQTMAACSVATEILYGGAAGGGKSHLFRGASIMWCSEIPGLQVYFFRRTFPDLWRNHMEGPSSFPMLLQPWVEAGFVKINYGSKKIEFWNGSCIHLNHCQYDKDRWNYQGAEIHVLIMDELTQFSDLVYRFLRGRVRLAGLKIPKKYEGMFPRILNGSNPGGVGHNWVKAMFVDYSPNMSIKRAEKEEGGMLRQYIPALMGDNPTLMKDDPDYEYRLDGLGDPALVEAMKIGNWDIVSGGMFDDVWNRSVHLVQPFVIPQDWRIDRSFDWGSTAPFSVGWWAESNGNEVVLADGRPHTFQRGSLFRIAEWYGWNGKPNKGLKMLATEVARGIKEREMAMGIQHRVQKGPADSSIWNYENGKSIEEDMRMLGVSWTKANKSPGSRKLGWEEMRKLFKNAMTGEDGPGMFIFDNCVNFARTVPTLPRDEKDTDDVDSGSEDHIGDETRYRALTAKPAELREVNIGGT